MRAGNDRAIPDAQSRLASAPAASGLEKESHNLILVIVRVYPSLEAAVV
jgi:hypothetical protein